MTIFHAATLALLTALSTTAHAAPDGAIAAAAAETRERCYPLVHEDTDEYRDCLFGLLKSEPEATPRRLGIEYFGWVGAAASQRTAIAGAKETADQFLWRFRNTQRALKLADQPLCASVEGDCTVRIAQMKRAEAALSGKAPAAPAQREPEPRTPERH